jgi:S1-C subfamily serine protease
MLEALCFQECIIMENIWQQLSKEISDKVASVGESVVVVDGRSGHTSSGIVWRADYAFTASHTIRGEGGIEVLPASGKSVGARLVGRAHGSDIALLKLDAPLQAKPADFGDTASLAVGGLVVAIGRTRRGNIVASSGILSGLMGEWRSGRARIDQFIRPDLTLYPGFSGGMLIDSSGKVLGMTTSGLLQRRPLAIPTSTLQRIGEELIAKGHAASPYVGLVMQPVSIPEKIQKTSGVAASTGLLILHVEASSPADSGGVLLGDILVSLDGQSFEGVEDLHDVLLRQGINQKVSAVLIRGGQKLELALTIGERPLR